MDEKQRLQGDWQEEAGRQMESWLDKGFERMNVVLMESGVIESLQEMFSQKGIQESYLVFDALENSRGFPIPVRTRYVLPIFTDSITFEEEAYPGIAVNETIGFGVRTLDIQFGLDREDMQKVGRRGKAVTHKEHDWHTKRPNWWRSSRYATDMTREYDLSGDSKKAIDEIAQEGDHKGMLMDIYSWGKAKRNPMVVSAIFEIERMENHTPEREWEKNQEAVHEGLLNLAKMIDAIQGKGQ